jgi:hypothetical protein
MRGTYRGSLPRCWSGCRYALAVALVTLVTGCYGSSWDFRPEDQFGRTYYLDGAGNWGFGRFAVPQGLHDAGYRGRVATYRWSVTFNPAIDQTIGRYMAKAKARQLAREIEHYLQHYPGNQVNIIALSAGTGVAIWACEELKPTATVQNLIMLSSSLSSSYDMRKALAHIKGTVYVYTSPNDGVLSGPVQILGTIDGSFDVAPAGLAGLRSPSQQIRNIAWSRKYEAYGWTGSHVSAVREEFVRQVLARHIVTAAHADAVMKEQDGATLVTMQKPAPPASVAGLKVGSNDGYPN